MTTGMKQDQTTDTYPERKHNWLLPAVGVALAVALLVWLFSPKDNQTTPSSTGSSVQQGATGQQGSVGSYSNTVVPAEQSTPQNTNTPDYQTVPKGSKPGTHPLPAR